VIRRILRQIALLLLLALVPGLVSEAVQTRHRVQKPLAAGEIRAATARQWGDQVQWVDARPPERFEAGHIPGAFRFRVEEWDALLSQFLDVWDLDKTVVVYCDGGDCDASRALADRLREELQIKNVYVLQGGWPEWQAK
jgi:rhodanese-related sulfurtransferase